MKLNKQTTRCEFLPSAESLFKIERTLILWPSYFLAALNHELMSSLAREFVDHYRPDCQCHSSGNCHVLNLTVWTLLVTLSFQLLPVTSDANPMARRGQPASPKVRWSENDIRSTSPKRIRSASPKRKEGPVVRKQEKVR